MCYTHCGGGLGIKMQKTTPYGKYKGFNTKNYFQV